MIALNELQKNSLESFITHGYAKLINEQLDVDLIQEFYSSWKTFFESEEKHYYAGDLNWPIGYIGEKNQYQGHHIPYEDFYYQPS